MSEEGRRHLDLLDLIKAHPGKRILDALHAYRATTDVLAGNARQLRKLIQSLEDPADPLEIGPMGERAKLQRLFGEVFRLFHNFLSSVKTLIDHTRNLVNEDFVTEAHRSEYEAAVQQEFASDPLARFMQDFRNTVLDPQFFADHKGKPLRFSQNGVDFFDTGMKLPAPTAPAADRSTKAKAARSSKGKAARSSKGKAARSSKAKAR